MPPSSTLREKSKGKEGAGGGKHPSPQPILEKK